MAERKHSCRHGGICSSLALGQCASVLFHSHRVTQNPSMAGVGRDLCGSPSPTPCPSRVTQSRLHSTASRRVLNISREGDSPTLGSLFQGSIILRVKRSPSSGQLFFFVKNKTFLCLWSRLNHLQLPAAGCTRGCGCTAEEPSVASLLRTSGLQLSCLCSWYEPPRAVLVAFL